MQISWNDTNAVAGHAGERAALALRRGGEAYGRGQVQISVYRISPQA